MNDFTQQISSISWWLSVVIVGIAINLFSAYIKPKLDTWTGALSKRIRDKNKAKTDAWEKDVNRLSEDGVYRAMYSNKVSFEYLESIFFVLAGASLLIIGSIFGHPPLDLGPQILSDELQSIARFIIFLGGSISILIGFINHIIAGRMARKLSEADSVAMNEKR